jgi:hypothetical protein
MITPDHMVRSQVVAGETSRATRFALLISATRKSWAVCRFSQERASPPSDAVIYGHLAGEHTVGVYPLLEDDSCNFLAVDFEETEWR